MMLRLATITTTVLTALMVAIHAAPQASAGYIPSARTYYADLTIITDKPTKVSRDRIAKTIVVLNKYLRSNGHNISIRLGSVKTKISKEMCNEDNLQGLTPTGQISTIFSSRLWFAVMSPQCFTGLAANQGFPGVLTHLGPGLGKRLYEGTKTNISTPSGFGADSEVP